MFLIALLPLFLCVAVAIKWNDGGPVFYRGERVGRGGRLFRIFKFRSMVVHAEAMGGCSTSGNDARLTRVGAFIRRYKIDELPQLINVLKGEMSLVGPRPEVSRYVALYSEEEQLILTVRPGITDWASIWNADEGSFLAGTIDPEKAYEELIRPTKLALQLFYVRNHSLWIDVRILFCTLFRLARVHWLPHELRSCKPLKAAK